MGRRAEFPTTIEAAKEARLNGLQVMMGAPNLVLGSSHSGNVSAMELVELDLVNIISSDYVTQSLLQSIFVIAKKTGNMKPTIDNIIKILSEKGQRQYDCEAVSQLEHALQCATLAEKNRSTKELIIACLLHDLGNLLHDLGEEAAIGGIDDRHEYAAASFLSSKFDRTINFSVQSNF